MSYQVLNPIMLKVLSGLLFLLPMGFIGKHSAVHTMRHNIHITYTKMAVEDSVITAKISFFSDDFQNMMRKFTADKSLIAKHDGSQDSILVRYLNNHFKLKADNDLHGPEIISSGEDNRMCWYTLQYVSHKDIHKITITNDILFEVFNDQKNLFQVMHFPDGKEQSFYFVQGAATYSAQF